MTQNFKAGLAGAGIFAASFASGATGYGAYLAVPAQMGTVFFASLAAKFISSVVASMIIGGIFAALASALAAVALVSLVNFVMQRMSGGTPGTPGAGVTALLSQDAINKIPAANVNSAAVNELPLPGAQGGAQGGTNVAEDSTDILRSGLSSHS